MLPKGNRVLTHHRHCSETWYLERQPEDPNAARGDQGSRMAVLVLITLCVASGPSVSLNIISKA